MLPFWLLPWGEQPHFGEAPRPCEPDEAQRLLPVPLLAPESAALPEGTTLGRLSVRPEGAEKWASARWEISGGGRALRLKQFHFDWWRPTEISATLARTLGFYRAGDEVVAWGRDRRGRAAAAMLWGRTMLSLRIERGTFVEMELRALLASLAPAVPEALPTLVAPAFPTLSYHVRRGRGPAQLDELAAARWHGSRDELAAHCASPILLPKAMPEGWRFDAGAWWPAPPPSESQWLLRDARGAPMLYARARPTRDPQPLRLPAHYRVAEGWKVRQSLVRRRRTTVAVQHPDLGGWSAAWAEGSHRYQLFVRAGALPGLSAFLALLEGLEAA